MIRLSGRNVFNVSLMVLLSVGLIWIWLKLHQPNTLPIETVKIIGTFKHITHAEVKQAVVPFIDTGFFSVKLHALSNKLLDLPWVASVSVSRIWPGTLEITIYEQKAFVRWNNGVLTANGEAFFPAQSTIPTELPWLQGPQGQQQQVLGAYQAMSTMLKPIGLSISRLTLSDRWAWSMQLKNGINVLIGRNQPQQHLARFINAYKPVLAARSANVAQVDLRYPNGMAVNWKK